MSAEGDDHTRRRDECQESGRLVQVPSIGSYTCCYSVSVPCGLLSVKQLQLSYELILYVVVIVS